MPTTNKEEMERTRELRGDELRGTTTTTTAAAATASAVQPEAEPAPEKKPGLFDGLCLPQIIAGAAAASTSLFLSSSLGIAGSVIGAAVSSVVTVVCSQLYRRALDAGATKMQQGKSKLDEVAMNATTAIGTAGAAAAASDKTTVLESGDLSDSDLTATRVAPDDLRERADERDAAKRAETQKKVIIFSVVLAIVAVAVCAGAILLGTHGEGLGEKTEIISLATDDDADEDAQENADTGTESGATSAESTEETASTQTDADETDGSAASADAATETEAEDADDQGDAEDDTVASDAANSSGTSTDIGSAETDGTAVQ